jgi:hypothetical protein
MTPTWNKNSTNSFMTINCSKSTKKIKATPSSGSKTHFSQSISPGLIETSSENTESTNNHSNPCKFMSASVKTINNSKPKNSILLNLNKILQSTTTKNFYLTQIPTKNHIKTTIIRFMMREIQKSSTRMKALITMGIPVDRAKIDLKRS